MGTVDSIDRKDQNLLEQIIDSATTITNAAHACVLFSNQKQLDCLFGSRCPQCSFGSVNGCSVSFDNIPKKMCQLLDGQIANGYITRTDLAPSPGGSKKLSARSQMIIPLKNTSTPPQGVLIFEANQDNKFRQRDIKIAESVSQLCAIALQKSKMLETSDRMNAKLKLLSDASNVLLSELGNTTLSEKLDYIVMKSTEILDAQLCSLWRVDGENLSLETSYSEKGKETQGKKILSPISNKPELGLTGYIAYECKKNRHDMGVFNRYGEELQNLRAMAKVEDPPAPFVAAKDTYSELACPILDQEKKFFGLLFAYNKKDEKGQPLKDAGFSDEFDVPLMKILATKIAISLRNAEQLKKLRRYELIVESTPDPVIISARDGKIDYMNPGGFAIFGDLLGKQVGDCYYAKEGATGLDTAREIKKQLYKTKDQRLKNYEAAFLSKNGEPIPISISVCLLHDERSNEEGTIGIGKDLRNIKRLTDAGQSLLGLHDTDEVLKQITEVAIGLSDSVRAYIKIYDEKTDTLVFKALKTKNFGEVFPVKETPVEYGMTGYVFKTQIPIRSPNVHNETDYTYYNLFVGVKSKIVVPITYIDKESGNKRKLGVISVDSNSEDAFSTSDQYYLETLANYAAIALENANLILSKNTIIGRLRAFERVQQSTTGKDLNVEQIYTALLEAVVDILGFHYATISEVDKNKKLIGTIKSRNVDDSFLAESWHSLESKDIQAWVARHKEHEYLTDWDDRLDREIFEKYQHHKLVRVIIPIIARGDVLGTLETGYQKHEKTEISKEEIADLKRLVTLAAVGIEQTNLLTKLKEDIALRNSLENQLDALNEASIQILNSTTEREAIDHIFRSLKTIGYHKGMLSLVDKSNQCIIGMYALGKNWQKIQTAAKFELNGNNLLAHVLRSRSPRLSKNCFQDARWDKKLAREATIMSQYIIPMVVKNEPIGTLQIDLSEYHDLVHGDETLFKRRMKVLETFASQSAIAIRNVRSTFTIDRLQTNIAETAHEFRSPLHNIMTQVGGLKDTLEYSKDEKEIDRFVNVIEEEIYRAKRQVDNSLLLSDRTRETIEYNFEEGYLQNVINDCVDAYKFRALERGIRLIVRDSVKKLPPVKFDHDKIAQAITNLIDNAVKYSYDHQYIDIIGFDDGTWIKIEVSDRGMGIPPQEFETIFKGFERSEARDKFRYIPGTGLGLKICKEIVEKHGGKIGVSSVPVSHSHRRIADYQDYKTSFRIQLPKYRKERLS